MHSSINLSIKQRFFVVSSVVLGSILLSASLLSASGRRTQQVDSLPLVQDRTGSLQLISLERNDERVAFVWQMQNTSKKAITAYGNAVCDVPESMTDYTIANSSIKPGAVVEIWMPTRVVQDKCDPVITQPTITIVAVLFDDGTYGGEFRWAKGMLDDRRGNKIQLKRINTLLAKALKWPDAGEATAIERLKAEIESLPIDEGEAPAVRGGLAGAKDRVLYLLGELKQWHQSGLTAQSVHNIPIRAELAGIKDLREGIDKIISFNERWISRD